MPTGADLNNAPQTLISEVDYAIRLQKTGRETQQSQSLRTAESGIAYSTRAR